jgi:hypothetical protein
MCISCFSNGELLAANAMLAGSFSRTATGWLRLRQVTPEQRLRLRQQRWDVDAAFLAGLGLDPVVALGVRPDETPK